MQILNAEFCSQYAEFPWLEDRDFQDLARERMRRFGHEFLPPSHHDVTEYLLEIWLDGMATCLRMVREDGIPEAG